MTAEFKAIDPKTYVDWSKAQWAQKSAKIGAERVPAGTVVETIMADGHVETKKTAGADGGYKVTNPNGEQYLVDPAKFEKSYQQTSSPGVFEPKYNPVQIVQISENIAFKAPWGEDMKIKAGGVLVKAGDNDTCVK